jgi:Rod binding domain-containing protein
MIALHPTATESPGSQDSQLRKRVGEFEGMLLAQILEKLKDSYRVPGDDDSDSTGESFQSLANSALGNSLAAKDSMGISKLLLQSLTSKPKIAPG